MAGQTFLTANSFLGLGLEGSYSGSTWTNARNTASSNIKFIPITSPQVTPNQVFLRDEAIRGSAVTTYGHVAGVRHDEYDAKGFLYADTFPILMRALLGGTDTVTGSTTYTHTLKLLNDQVGSQPPSLSIQDFDGANAFQMLGNQAADMTLTFGAEAPAEWTAKFMGNPYTQISTPSATFSTSQFVPGWNVTTSIGGAGINYVVDGEIKIDRKTAPIFTQGTQAPRVNFAGPIEVTGRLLMVVDSTSDLFTANSTASYALYDSPQPVVITLTDPVTTYASSFTMSSVQFHDAKRNRGKSFVEIETQFTAEANATDASGGFSPLKFVQTNNVPGLY